MCTLLQCEARMKPPSSTPPSPVINPLRYTMQYIQGLDVMIPEGENMPRRCWPCAVVLLFVVIFSLGAGRAVPLAFVLRFSDTLPTPDVSHQAGLGIHLRRDTIRSQPLSARL
jgi:hypothetical protein